MVKQVRVRYRRGVLELLEPLEIEEGAELTVMLSTPEAIPTAANPTAATAVAWASLLDREVFEQELYANRLLQTRAQKWSCEAALSVGHGLDCTPFAWGAGLHGDPAEDWCAPILALSILSLGELYEGVYRARDPAAAERAVMTKRQSVQVKLLVKDAEDAIKANG
jgi:hypothetical protein